MWVSGWTRWQRSFLLGPGEFPQLGRETQQLPSGPPRPPLEVAGECGLGSPRLVLNGEGWTSAHFVSHTSCTLVAHAPSDHAPLPPGPSLPRLLLARLTSPPLCPTTLRYVSSYCEPSGVPRLSTRDTSNSACGDGGANVWGSHGEGQVGLHIQLFTSNRPRKCRHAGRRRFEQRPGYSIVVAVVGRCGSCSTGSTSRADPHAATLGPP